MLREIMESIASYDKEVGEAILQEFARQRRNIELIASENRVSEPVMIAAGTILTNKYAEGYPGKRFYGGCEVVDIIETLAIERVKKLFGAKYANVQPHSGASANLAVFMALVKPGDRILGMNLDHGGHLTHGHPANFSGKYYNVVAYGIDPVSNVIDYDDVRKKALEHKPQMIIAGASAYARAIDFKKFSEIAKEVGAYLFCDMAHIAGLVAAGLHQNPVPYCDVITSTTHKTLRGPRGGFILTNDENMAKKINSAVFPGGQGGPLMHIIGAKAVAFGEALKPEFKVYQQNVLDNAKALAKGLMDRGFDLVSGGTDNHLMLADLRKFNVTGIELERNLDEVHITVNKNKIPNDPQSANVTSGIRLGSPAVTSRGFTQADMDKVAELIYLAASDYKANGNSIRAGVTELTEKYPLYK